MRRVLSSLGVAASLCAATTARAETAWSDRFFQGTTPGEVPTAKVFTVGGLYTLSIASLGVGAVSLLDASRQAKRAERFKLEQPRGFCGDPSVEPCSKYHELLNDERRSRTFGVAFVGVGGLFAVGGALLAELWPNHPRIATSVALDPRTGDASLALRASF